MNADLKTIMIMLGLIADIIVGSLVYHDIPIAELKANIGNIVDSNIVNASNLFSANKLTIKSEGTDTAKSTADNTKSSSENGAKQDMEEVQIEEIKTEENIVYDNLTLDELADKLNRSLGSTLSGTGYQFATRAVELGIDPYMAVAIVLEETGCAYDCSELVKQCHNVGGQKGYPGCWGGEYQSFYTLEEGIDAFMYNLYYNYVAYGLTTPELINPKYAENTAWATNVNNYINIIRST